MLLSQNTTWLGWTLGHTQYLLLKEVPELGFGHRDHNSMQVSTVCSRLPSFQSGYCSGSCSMHWCWCPVPVQVSCSHNCLGPISGARSTCCRDRGRARKRDTWISIKWVKLRQLRLREFCTKEIDFFLDTVVTGGLQSIWAGLIDQTYWQSWVAGCGIQSV